VHDRSRFDRPVDAVVALPFGFAGLLAIGVITVAANGRLTSTGVLVLATVLVAVMAALSEPLAAPPLAVIGWFTVSGFSHAPYGDLHAAGSGQAAVVVGAAAAGATAVATLLRRLRRTLARYSSLPAGEEVTLDDVTDPVLTVSVRHPHAFTVPGRLTTPPPRLTGITRTRQLAGLVLAAVLLPALTAVLAANRAHLGLIDDLLLYLLAVLAVTVLGGFWPSVLAAVSAGLLLNWYFTPPVHTWTIEAPQNLLALLLFVTGAVTVSSVVHLAARRDALARARAEEANTLLGLAQTVLGGDDTPDAVLAHLAASLNTPAELQERINGRWTRIAGTPIASGSTVHIPAGENLRLSVEADAVASHRRVLDGYAAQAASALDRQRLRIQAGQAEALAEGNRMRTALLTAVSHDLRTPLASVKASVSTLRQTDVDWTVDDQAALLATIEQGADRLDRLIGNLLDMSRVHTGALKPFLRPTALDEVAPLLARNLDGGDMLSFDIPDDLPLLAADPGLLERALSNLAANALRYSPPQQPPTIVARAADHTVIIEVVDHGPGIPPEKRAQVFEPFQQLGDQRSGGGVGLGLAVAKGFVDAMGGRIAAAVTPGGGLTMHLELPTADHQRSDDRHRARP
jgi:two-component system, OmpR family, sensor histidine kinase KdpD